MNRTFLTILIFSLNLGLITAKIHTLKGIVTEQSSSNKPIVGAQVTARGATPDRTREDGRFNLIFVDKEPGSEVFIKINKEGYEVVNEKELYTVLKSNQEKFLKIYMCKKGVLSQNRMKYYNIAESNILKIYKAKVAQLKQKNRLNEQTIAKLEKEKELHLKQAQDLADKFARVNFDDVSDMYKRAFSYFQQGNIDNALNVLNTETLNQNLHKAEEEISKAKRLKSEAEEREKNAKKIKEQTIESLILKAHLYRIDLQFNRAEDIYEIAVKADPMNFEYTYDFVSFLYDQRKYFKALPICKAALSIAIDKGDKVTIHNLLGLLYAKLDRQEEALNVVKKAVIIAESMAEENPGKYLPKLTDTLSNLGTIYASVNEYDCAFECYERLFDLYKEDFFSNNPKTYLPQMAESALNLGAFFQMENNYPSALRIYKNVLGIFLKYYREEPAYYLTHMFSISNNIGLLYNKTNQFKKAIPYFKMALEMVEKLTDINPEKYSFDLAKVLNNLGVLYRDTHQYIKALSSFKRTLKIYETLAEDIPQVYIPYLGMSLNNLGIVYEDLNRIDESLKALHKAHGIIKPLSHNNPKKYLPLLCDVLNNLGRSYSSKNDVEKALTYHEGSVRMMEKLAEENAKVYLPKMAGNLNNIGVLYRKKGRYPEALSAYQKALEIWAGLAKKDANTYLPRVASCLNNLGSLYLDLKEYQKAISSCEKSLKIREKLVQKDPKAYLPMIAITLNNLGLIYLMNHRYPESLSSYKRALAIREKLAKKAPEIHDLDFCSSLINLAAFYAQFSNYDPSHSFIKEGATLVEKAILTLTKYDQFPIAKEHMKKALLIKDYLKKLNDEIANQEIDKTNIDNAMNELLNPFVFKIKEISKDKSYGYSENNPIKVGGVEKHIGPINERRFLNALLGPNGEKVLYKRIGSCCRFKTENALFGNIGMLDKYEITFEGLDKPIIIYINFYDYGELKCPYGFTFVK